MDENSVRVVGTKHLGSILRRSVLLKPQEITGCMSERGIH